MNDYTQETTLVLGGNGKTGRRVVDRLRGRGLPVRVGSRSGEPPLRYLFTEVLDGRNAELADGVKRALRREPRDFRDYARTTAATGVWAGCRSAG